MAGNSAAGETAGRFNRAAFAGGPLVLTEEMPWVRSAAVGVWVRFGSAHERGRELGVSHLLEHMVFKGTPRREAREIALVLERSGGSLDAYTTREYTSYHARVLDKDLDLALDVLCDMVLKPLLRAEDLELEREVVLEEISTVEDTPDDLVFELHTSALWGSHPYGHSILGTRETVSSLTAEDLRRAHDRGYGLSNLVIGVAGNIRTEAVLERLSALLFERPPELVPAPEGPAPDVVPVPEVQMLEPREVRVERATAQTHLVFGTQTFRHGDPRRYAMVLLSNAFGGGMSSRLFQRVREELGLAYAVYSFQSFYRQTGLWGVYAGTRHEWADHARDVITEELKRLASDGLTAEELEDAKGQVKGQMVLGLEASGGRLQRLASTALYDEPFLSMDELVRRVDAVTLDDVAAVAAEFCRPDRQVVLRLGPA
ncbi:MAG TPA: pitrilysin family protein [Longimicrobiales bacterium]|nr:pitrilysin family protein [Longimicrobiales bacterium]